jgi:nitrite reductase (cytochrome c-552)
MNLCKAFTRQTAVYWVLFLGALGAVFVLGALSARYLQREAERRYVYKPTVEIRAFEPRNQIWGENFPKEYDSYTKTAETNFKSKHNGNAPIDMLEVDPRLVVLWAGYAFSKDYKQGRGHYYAIQDVYDTLRTGGPTSDQDGPQPTTCWTCKSPDVPRMMNEEGITKFYTGKWSRLGSQIVNYIGCADCHNEQTMDLQISRPALVEAFARQGKDIKQASHQEMRSLVCAQCHVEYYFDKHKIEGTDYLTFPWDKGMNVDAMERYYDEVGHVDWVHQFSRAPMLKAQHPDYEVFKLGIHAQRGLACADCHMPYKAEGMQKFSDHHIQSPLNNVEATCQVCHREKTEDLVRDVYERQDKLLENRDRLEVLLVRAHLEAKAAWDAGATEAQMKPILQEIRHAQWRWDFAAAGHGNSFHAPVEIARLVGAGIDKAQNARVKLAGLLVTLGVAGEVPYPDLSSKAKAQTFIGLDLPKLQQEKDVFKQNLLPKWLEAAKQREAGWGRKLAPSI